jgi:hypothetical protein
MSDVRVPIEKEYDNPKRRHAGTSFGDLMARQSCATQPGASVYALMSDFQDKALSDGKLDDNELAGMRVLAGMTPTTQAAQQSSCPSPAGTQAMPAQTPPASAATAPTAQPNTQSCDSQPEATPTAGTARHFNQAVATELDKSKDWDSGETMVMQTAQRLANATLQQRTAFMEQLCKMLADNDIDESGRGEASQLSAFVDGLFAAEMPPKVPSAWSGGQATSAPREEVIRNYLRHVLSHDRVSRDELLELRRLVDEPMHALQSVGNLWPEEPLLDATQLSFNPSTTREAQTTVWLNGLLASGRITYESAQQILEMGRRRAEMYR